MIRKKIQVVALALIIIMPLVFTVVIALNDSKSVCELVEATSEEEEKSEEKDTLDEFLVHNASGFVFSKNKALSFLEKKNFSSLINREILTPPPELI